MISPPCQFELGGVPGSRVVLQFSEDLRSWVDVSTHDVPGSVEIPIPPGRASGFYRAVVRP